MVQDLDFIRDKVTSFFAVAGDCGAGHGQLYSQIQFDGGVDNGIESEDLLFAVGILGVSSDADSRVGIVRHFGTPEEEGIGFGGVPHDNFRKDPSLDHQIEPCLLKFFLDAKYLVEDAGFFRIGLPQTEGKDLHLGAGYLGMIRKSLGGAFNPYPHVFEERLPVRIVHPIEDPAADIFDNADEFDAVTFFFEPGAALVSGVGGKEGSIGGYDLVGEESEQLGDLHQDVKDPVVKFLPQSLFEVGEGGLAGDILRIDPSVKTVMFPPFPIPKDLHEGFHVGVFFEVAAEIEKKKTYGIIGDSGYGISMGDQGTDEGKIYQGGYKPGQSSFDSSAIVDADIPPFINILG